MAPRTDVVELPRGERVRRSRRQGTSMSLPLAVYHRLDLLTELASDVDATRAELVAMLICDAPLDSAALEQAVLRYRKLTVGDVIPEQDTLSPQRDEADDGKVVSIRRRRPGRRPSVGG
jgi:hypothetical protein